MAFTSDLSEEDALLRARIDDACQLCEWRSCPRFVGFLDEHRQAVARAVLREKGLSEKAMRGKVDMIAASLFLQAWLDARSV